MVASNINVQFGATPSPLDATGDVPEDLKQGKSSADDSKSGLPVPNYNTDTLGAGTDVPDNPTVVPEATPASTVKSFVSGVGYTGRDYYAAAREKFLYDPDPSFDAKSGYDEFVKVHGLTSDTEMTHLLSAPSEAAQKDRIAFILDKRDREKAGSDNIVPYVIGSVFDIDMPIALAGGVFGVGAKAAGATRAAQRVVAASSAAGIMGGVVASTGDATTLNTLDHTINIVASGVGGAFALTKPRTTPLKPTSPNSTVQTAGVLEEAPIASQSLPLPTGSPSKVTSTKSLEEQIEEEIAILSTPTPNTVASVSLGGEAKVNFDIANSADMSDKIKKSWVARSEIAAKMQSVADEMFFYLKGDLDDPMSRLVPSAAYTLGDDAGSLAHAIQAEGAVRLTEFEKATEVATKELYGTSGILGRIVGKYHTANQRKAFMRIYTGLQRVDQRVLELLDEGMEADVLKLIDELDEPEVIKNAIRTYVDSGYATNVYDHMKRVGLLDDELKGLPRRSTYVPLQHDYTRTRKLIYAAGDDAAESRLKSVAVFLGEQIQRTYPSLAKGITRLDGTVVRLDAETLGRKFIDNAKARVDNPSAVRTTGVARNELHDIMVAHGIPEDEAAQLVLKVAAKRTAQHGLQYLRPRIKWDWNKEGTMPNGEKFNMSDLIDEHQFSKLNEYNRRTSKRIALAKYGFKDRAALDEDKQRMLDNLPEGVDRGKAARSIDNVINTAIGNPVGEGIPEVMRSLNATAGAFLLAWSGLYNTVEAGVQIMQVGLLRSLPELLPALKPVLKGMKGYTVSEAKGMRDIITGMAMDEGRWKNIFTQYSDDFNVGNSFHEGVQYLGQSTRFLNASEFIKRWQIGMYAGVVTKTFEGAAKGTAKDIKFLKDKMRMSDDLIASITTEWNKHGDNINAWDADVRITMEQKTLHEMGNHALSIQHGETPAFLEHTSWGKMVFPFMSFVWGAHNKLLRRTYVRDGALAVAMVLAVQFPMAVVVSNIKRAASGEEPYDLDDATQRKEFIQSLLASTSGLGIFSIPMDIILSEGRNLGSVAAFAPIGKTMALANATTSEEGATFRDIKENTPLNVPLGVSLFMAMLEEDE